MDFLPLPARDPSPALDSILAIETPAMRWLRENSAAITAMHDAMLAEHEAEGERFVAMLNKEKGRG